MVMGRPTDYTEELAKEICDAIANSPFGLRTLCRENPHWPDRLTILRWLREKENFNNQYRKAKDYQADYSFDEMVDIAYNDKKDHKVIVDDHGNEKVVCVSESVNRSRLKVDTLKYRAALLAPKKYCEKRESNLAPETQSLLQGVIDKL